MLGCADLDSDGGMNESCHRVDCRRRLTGAVEPRKIRLFTKPDQLPARVAPVLLRDERARRRLVSHAVQVLERLTVDEAAERSGILRNPTIEQRSDLIEQTSSELLVDAASDAF